MFRTTDRTRERAKAGKRAQSAVAANPPDVTRNTPCGDAPRSPLSGAVRLPSLIRNGRPRPNEPGSSQRSRGGG